MIKLTVISTVYNQAAYVAQMIESVLMQKTNFDFEFIIANDCSTDNSGEIIQEYASKNSCIKFIDNENNLGLIRNYTQCLEKARGKYIAGLGGDDFYIDPDKLQMQVDFMEANPGYGMVHTQFDELYMQKRGIKPRYMKNCQKEAKYLEGDIFLRLAVNNKVNAVTVCYKRSLIVESDLIERFNRQEYHIEDLPMWLEISRTHKVGYINKSTVCYRRNDNSACHFKDIEESLQYNKHTLFISKTFLEKQKLDKGMVDFYCSQHESITYSYFYFKKNDLKNYIKHYNRLVNKPWDRIVMLWVLRLRLGFLFN
ncbi:glycosyltransferase family 2 protein [Carboxylicivirga sp. RSCT41]|uniref:glycosyltransferase family 2 protein n=1 Tax=Carboxylicivirga agarovorans TaxID=3417570 RepID=UPI003D336F8B